MIERQYRKWLTPLHRWTLAGLSVGGFAAAVVALLLSQLVPEILQGVATSGRNQSQLLKEIAVGLSMSLGAVVGFGAGYRTVTRYGSRLEQEGSPKRAIAFAVGVIPWIAIFVWLWWQTQ